ncbi:hypothetical protein EDC39_105177 [Geothermobacter ehrlichii]|uniref:HAMP domain-containing protein n=1 Tax=Geothermobacter ehrlichii TaxID=213224 RepID=A0A5D3WKC7_9BACT|nr:methyl-accepting chemotaxis protein [Geothermobacter ehrlichii]TYO98808.1 hypothetical protein EDC39_105177 [Geothermobacter ehrlichii]
MKNDKPIEPVFTLKFQFKYSLAMVFSSIVTSLVFFYCLDQGLGDGYFESLVTLSQFEATLPEHLIWSFCAQLVLIFLMTVAIHLFVSHKIAGPVYRYELSLTSILKDDLRFDVRTRRNDQLKPMVHALNDFIESMRLMYGGIAELRKTIDEEMKKENPDPDIIRQHLRRVRESMGEFHPAFREGER